MPDRGRRSSGESERVSRFLAGPDPDYDTDPGGPRTPTKPTGASVASPASGPRSGRSRQALAQIDQVSAWAERRYEVLHGRARWEQAGLEMWHRAVLADDPSRKSISLPCGTLKSVKQQPRWVFDDEVFIAWAREHAPSLVRVPEPKPAVDRNGEEGAADRRGGEGAHSILTEEGEVVPG